MIMNLKTKKGTKKKIIGLIIAVLAVLIFIFITPSSARYWYQMSVGLSYDKQLKAAGLSHQQSIATTGHELRISKAKRQGVIYALLMVNGLPLPLLSLLLVTTGIIMRVYSHKVQRYLVISLPLLCIWGIACSGLAHRMVSLYPKSLPEAFLGASFIWLGIAALFGIVILIAAMIWHFANRSGEEDQ
jgi:hypothetical protein